MSMGGTSARRAEEVRERVIVSRRAGVEASPEEKARDNPVFQVMFDPSNPDPNAKKGKLKELLAPSTKEENREKVATFDAFKEYINAVSEKLSRDRIAISSTETHKELQGVIKDFNNDLEDFMDTMQPLNAITDAIYKLRTEGRTKEALEKIREDRIAEEKMQEEIARLNNELDRARADMRTFKDSIIQHSQNKGWLGYGPIKPESMSQIKIAEERVSEIESLISNLEKMLDAANQKQREYEERAEADQETKKLRELLDLSSEEHVARQKMLVEKALSFIDTGKEKFGNIRVHLDKIKDQYNGLSDNASSMKQVYAILNEATTDVEKDNQRLREELSRAPENETPLEKLKREERLSELNAYIEMLSATAVDTMQGLGDLAIESSKIANGGASARQQSDVVRTLHTRGIATVASQLSTMLTAINSAAINEAHMAAGDILKQMSDLTNSVAQKDAIRVATGRDNVNNDIESMIFQLQEFSDVQRDVTAITTDTVARMRQNIADLQKFADGMNEEVRDFTAATAEVIGGADKKPVGPATISPFKG